MALGAPTALPRHQDWLEKRFDPGASFPAACPGRGTASAQEPVPLCCQPAFRCVTPPTLSSEVTRRSALFRGDGAQVCFPRGLTPNKEEAVSWLPIIPGQAALPHAERAAAPAAPPQTGYHTSLSLITSLWGKKKSECKTLTTFYIS